MYLKLISIILVIQTSTADYRLVFEDNFDGNSLNTAKWKFETGGEPNWGNHELQYYTHDQKNARVENGHLVIEAHPEEKSGKHFTSARLNSKDAWAYGKFEIRASLPKGKGLWPAIWLLPRDEKYGEWPASGEIDIVESRGEKSDTVEATFHYGGFGDNFVSTGSEETKFSDLSQGFHTFEYEWTHQEMSWSIDGRKYYSARIDKSLWSGKGKNPYTKNGQPFDVPFFLVLNVAVGGDFFPEDEYGHQVTPAEARNWPKPRMEIDYIRVYQM